MTDAIAAFGVTLERGVGLYPIAEITSIDGVEMTRETIDVTSHDQADTFKEYIAGLKDAGEISIEGNFVASDDNGQQGLKADLELGTLQSFVLTFPTSIEAAWSFSAYVTAFKVGGFPVDGKIAFTASLKISGKPNLDFGYAPDLTDLEITIAVLYPDFAGDTYAYTATTTGISVTVTPTCGTADYITVNGNVVASEDPSSPINAGVAGTNTPIVVKTYKAGKIAQTYKVTLVKTA